MTGTVWITGAAGYSGQSLLRHLRRCASVPRLVALDVVPIRSGDFDASHVVDLADSVAIGDLAEADSPTWVIHLAAAMPPAAVSDMWRTNVPAVVGLVLGLARARCHGVRVLSVGSAAEYAPGAPSPIVETALCGGASPYGDSKLAQSLVGLALAHERNIGLLVARPFNLVGPGLSERLVVGSLVQQFAAGQDTITVGNTHTARDFVDIRDAVRAYWLLVQRGRPGEIYNVCSGVPTPISALISVLGVISGHLPRISLDPARVRANDPVSVFGDTTRLTSTTGWRPEIPLERSLRDMLGA